MPRYLDVNPRQRVLHGDAMVACMDGADYITRLRMVDSELRRHDGTKLPKAGERHPIMQQFVTACQGLGLPINVGKKVIQDLNGAILGGELDGIRGSLSVAPEKGHKFVGKTCALLSVSRATQVACQHWSGLYCFAVGFRRPLFSVLEEMFGFIVKMEGADCTEEPLPNAVRDEVLLAGLLMQLATCNLRAPLRNSISISDASEFGGASAEAKRFVAATDSKLRKLASERGMTLLEEGSVAEQPYLAPHSVRKPPLGHQPVNLGGPREWGESLTGKLPLNLQWDN